MAGKARRITGTTLIVLGGVLLIGSAGAKLAQVPQVVAQMNSVGFSGEKITIIAILELVSALLFLIPATRSAGLLLVSSFLGGAIATHLQHGQPILPPSIMLILLWVGAWLRHPIILWSLGGNEATLGRPALNEQQQ
jgi:hypothetical protein